MLQYPVIGMLAQPCVLSFECFFPLVLFYNYSYILNITCIALILFGVSFHIGCLILFQIDFIHFWLPTYWSFLFYLKDEAMIKVLDNEAFLYHPLTIFMLISFVIAHIRVHSGLNWPNSSFDLYNTKLTKNKINYHALQLISNDNGNNIVPFDLSICSSSGMTRSFGYHYSKLLKNNDLNEFIHVFLPKLLIAEGYIYHGKLGFKGVQIVEIIIDIKSEGGYTLNPARLVGRYFWSYE